MSEATYVIFDCETTGLDVFNDRIVQLVIATADKDGNLLAHQEWIIDPGIPIPEEASAVHGFSNAYVQAHGGSPGTALEEAHDFFEEYSDQPWVAYNLSFDASILASEMDRHNVNGTFDDFVRESQLFDPLVVDRAKDKYRKGNRKLLTVAGHYGIPLDESKLHNALYDVEITARVASAVDKKYGIPSNDEQAMMYETWRTNFQEYLRRTDPDAIVDSGWPLKRKD